MEIYDTDLVNAKRLSIEKEYELIYKDIKKYLKQEFNITDEQARELIEINNSEDYSNRYRKTYQKAIPYFPHNVQFPWKTYKTNIPCSVLTLRTYR